MLTDIITLFAFPAFLRSKMHIVQIMQAKIIDFFFSSPLYTQWCSEFGLALYIHPRTEPNQIFSNRQRKKEEPSDAESESSENAKVSKMPRIILYADSPAVIVKVPEAVDCVLLLLVYDV